MPRLSSLFAIKCANRTHSRVVPGYKLECEGRACTNNKMAAELQPYTPSSLSGVPIKPPPLSVSLTSSSAPLTANKPTSHDASLPHGRKGCFAGARTSSILSECLAIWNIGRPDLENVFGPSLSVNAIVKNNEYPRSEIVFFFTFFPLLPFFPFLLLSLIFFFLHSCLLSVDSEPLFRWESLGWSEMNNRVTFN